LVATKQEITGSSADKEFTLTSERMNALDDIWIEDCGTSCHFRSSDNDFMKRQFQITYLLEMETSLSSSPRWEIERKNGSSFHIMLQVEIILPEFLVTSSALKKQSRKGFKKNVNGLYPFFNSSF
jgi:hypothetical protein